MPMLKHASLLHWMEKLKGTAKGRRYDTQLFLISKRKKWPIKFANCSRYKVTFAFEPVFQLTLFIMIVSEFSLPFDNKPSKRLPRCEEGITTNQVGRIVITLRTPINLSCRKICLLSQRRNFKVLRVRC